MLRAAIWLLILGIGSFILPMFGLQFRLLSVFGGAQTFVGAFLALLGLAFLGLHFSQKGSEPMYISQKDIKERPDAEKPYNY